MEIFRKDISARRITINGKTYSSVDEMPPGVRTQYEQAMQSVMADKDHNGVPDILEHPSSSKGKFAVSTTQTIIVNGRHYDRIEDVPEEFRGPLGKAMSDARLEANKAPLRLPVTQPESSSIGKWIILIAALITAAAIGWLLHAH